MQFGGDSTVLGSRDRSSNPVVSKTLKKKSVRRVKEVKMRLSSRNAELLLRKHCRGVWTDSDEDLEEERNILQDVVEANGENVSNPLTSEKSWGTTPSPSTLPATKVEGKRRKHLAVDERNSLTPQLSAESRRKHKASQPDETEFPFKTNETEKDVRSHQWKKQPPVEGEAPFTPSKRQVKGLRRWESMQPRRRQPSKAAPSESTTDAVTSSAARAGGSSTKSLELLKKIGGTVFSSAPQESHVDGVAEVRMQNTGGPGKERQQKQDAQKVFDETVHEIRNLVYPHLDRFQQRQFVTTALRALGINSTKTQKMPLPELLSRKKATAEALKARRAEAKILGVSSHIDLQGSVQQAARNRSKLTAQKKMRKHLRDTFKHAGKYTRKVQ